MCKTHRCLSACWESLQRQYKVRIRWSSSSLRCSVWVTSHTFRISLHRMMWESIWGLLSLHSTHSFKSKRWSSTCSLTDSCTQNSWLYWENSRATSACHLSLNSTTESWRFSLLNSSSSLFAAIRLRIDQSESTQAVSTLFGRQSLPTTISSVKNARNGSITSSTNSFKPI